MYLCQVSYLYIDFFMSASVITSLLLNIRLSWSFQECHYRFKHFIWQLKCQIIDNIKLSQWLNMSLHPKSYAYQRWTIIQFPIFLPYFRIEIYQQICYFLLRLFDKFLRINTFGSIIKKYAFSSSDTMFVLELCQFSNNSCSSSVVRDAPVVRHFPSCKRQLET